MTVRCTIDPDCCSVSASKPYVHRQPTWFECSKEIMNIASGLSDAGFADDVVAIVMWGNWYDFFGKSFGLSSKAVS